MENERPLGYHSRQEWNIDYAESSLLGAILLEGAGQPESGVIREIVKTIKPDDFFMLNHRHIFETMLEVSGAMNEITIMARMILHGSTPDRFLYSEFPRMISLCPCWLDYQSYTKAVSEYSDARNPNRKRKPDIKGGCNL